ncbi:hypothetical protein ACLB1Q_15975 [Escherichia coli]
MANDQRRAIYSQRNELLDVSDVSKTINSIREDVFKATIDASISATVAGRNVGYSGAARNV